MLIKKINVVHVKKGPSNPSSFCYLNYITTCKTFKKKTLLQVKIVEKFLDFF